MATMQSIEDMARPLDDARNLKASDRFPLLFLDEFDTDPSKYAALLPLLWDGELQVGHRNLRLGRAVIVLAGSNPNLPRIMDEAAQMRPQQDNRTSVGEGKLIDLLSRINGRVINLPDLDLHDHERDRRVDKACIAAELLRHRFGREVNAIPRALLRFVALTTFRYGVRSISHLIDLIGEQAYDAANCQLAPDLGLPFNDESALSDSCLKLHLIHPKGAMGIVKSWAEFSQDRAFVYLKKGFVPIWIQKFFRDPEWPTPNGSA